MVDFFDFKEQVSRPGKPAPSKSDEPALTVSQLTGQIERALRGLPQALLVRGEVSNYKHHGSSGHTYFTLKDPGACIDCVMFRSDAARLKFAPGDGMELLVTGRVGVYPQRGRYQLYVTSVRPLGQGALELAFQQVRAKLETEGLFAPERKRPLPEYPMSIAVVTSRHTAALQDMLKVLRRFPWVRVCVYDVPVQGDGAAERIATALRDLSRHGRGLGIDLILLGRGGGSLEDLWEFNEEIVARAMAACAIPIVTGIGHEVDVSIADLVADHHAHTPTEAAQVATGHWRTAQQRLEQSGIRLRRELRALVQDARRRLATVERHEAFRRPMDRIHKLGQFLDDQQRRLQSAARERVRTGQQRLGQLEIRLNQRHPRHEIELRRQQVEALWQRLHRGTTADLRRRMRELDALEKHLAAVSPEQVLRRGYSITTVKKTGAIVREAGQVRPGQRIVTRLAGGQIESTVEDLNQPGLFEG